MAEDFSTFATWVMGICRERNLGPHEKLSKEQLRQLRKEFDHLNSSPPPQGDRPTREHFKI